MSEKNRISNDDSNADLKKLFHDTTPDVPQVDVQELLNMRTRTDLDMDVVAEEAELTQVPAVSGTEKIASRNMSHANNVPTSVASRHTGKWKRVLVSFASLAAVVVVILLIVRGLPEKTAFADVQDRVNRLKTVQFTNFKTTPNDSATEARKLRVKILDRHLQITEVIGLPGMYDLIDSQAGRFITVDTTNKIYREIKTKVTIDQRTGMRTESKMKVPAHVDFYKNITSFPEDTFRHIGSGWVGPRRADRFQRVYVNGLTTRTVSIWVDPQSRLPLHVEIRLRSKDPAVEDVDFTFTDFVYDQALDPAQFDTNPPEGYRVVDGEFIERK